MESMILDNFKPGHDFFIGIDSDGCVFDSMGIKQRECFCPWMIGYFGLQPVAEAARQCKEFADLFSKTRGANRHKTIVRILTELLPNHPQVIERGFEVPKFEYYMNWVNDPESQLNSKGLETAIGKAKNSEQKRQLSIALAWSKKVDETVAAIVTDIPPVPYVKECLDKMRLSADIMVVSATPVEALEREWREHGIADYVNLIAGQEMGSKEQHLSMTARIKYKPNHSLMIGDAPGDLKAAKKNECLFYPITAGQELNSWKKLYQESLDRFIHGSYAGDYESKLIQDFENSLPEHPPW